MAIYYFELDAHGAPGLLGTVLREFGQQVKQIDVHRASTMPLDLDEVHGVIVSGGGASLTASSGATEAFVRDAVALEIPVLAIGAGARLAARALGGEVSPCSERGIVRVTLNALGREEPIFAGQRWTSDQGVWNDECVSKLPPDAKAFASTPSAKCAGWGLGVWVTAIDWHPEWSAKELAECSASGGGVTPQTVSDIERLGRLFAERVILMLMPVDRMNAGRTRDLLH